MAAGGIVGELYKSLRAQYKNPDNPASQQSLNKLCVRLVFYLYAEDAGVFQSHNQFGEYIAKYDAEDVRKVVIELFRVLDTPEGERDEYISPTLAAFPYVDGGLFADEDIEVPPFTEEIRTLLVE